MLGFYNYTVILTYIGMLISFTGMTFAWKGEMHTALVCLMLSGFCDMFDGKIASTKKDRTVNEKRFGIQIDSLSDLICFGVFPAMIIFQICKGSTASTVAAGIYLLCALIRLAYFNVEEENRQNHTSESRKIYLGLPVTTVAIMIPLIVHLGSKMKWPMDIIGPLVLGETAIAFISPIHIRKPELAGKILVLLAGVCVFIMIVMR